MKHIKDILAEPLDACHIHCLHCGRTVLIESYYTLHHEMCLKDYNSVMAKATQVPNKPKVKKDPFDVSDSSDSEVECLNQPPHKEPPKDPGKANWTHTLANKIKKEAPKKLPKQEEDEEYVEETPKEGLLSFHIIYFFFQLKFMFFCFQKEPDIFEDALMNESPESLERKFPQHIENIKKEKEKKASPIFPQRFVNLAFFPFFCFFTVFG